MNKVLLLSWLFCGIIASGDVPSLDSIRQLYKKSITDQECCRNLIELLKPYNESDNPLLAGYEAAATMMMARHLFNPFSKLSYFKKGKNLLQQAIYADSNNLELRFLRFSIQTNCPSFLGYNEQIGTDKTFLLRLIPLVPDPALKNMIVAFLINSSYITTAEKNKLES